MRQIIYILVSTLFLLESCSNGSKVKGYAYNPITKKALAGVYVTAYTSTNVEEDKKYQQITAKTNSNGEFVLKGLSSKYRYNIYIISEGYVTDGTFVKPPEDGKTVLLEQGIAACISPQGEGVFVLEDEKWRKMEFFQSHDMCQINDKVTVPFVPTNLNLPEVNISKLNEYYDRFASDYINGELTDKFKINGTNIVNNSATICYVGDSYTFYNLSGLYLFPKSQIYDQAGSRGYPGHFSFNEGYYAGIEKINGVGMCCRYLDIEAKTGDDYILSDLCKKSISSLHYGTLNLMPNSYYAIHQRNNSSFILLNVIK